MDIFYNIIFLVVGLIIWIVIMYARAYIRYQDKERIDKCYKERAELKEENEKLRKKTRELEIKIHELEKELEQAKREIMEKNKYLSEDKVIVERLAQVKELSDQISDILAYYDKKTIQHLIEEYKKWELCEIEKELHEEENKNEEKKW